MHKDDFLIRQNLKAARRNSSIELGKDKLASLLALTKQYGFSILLGDLLLLDGHWYATHAGLLRLAQRRRCSGIRTALQMDLSVAASERWVFKAIAYKSPRSRGFVGYGDADPSNVPSWLRGCELRIAETRAVNRALRKAYGIGLCSVEELGATQSDARIIPSNGNGKGSSNSKHDEPRLRDRLSLLIRQHRLDASLVKCYAAEFCGTQTLRDARREMAQEFLQHLAEWAARDLDGLVCHLNRYAHSSQPLEVHS
jgi:hypothetical protein